MPKGMEKALKTKVAAMVKKGTLKGAKGATTEEKKNAFVYGTMRKSGWKPKR